MLELLLNPAVLAAIGGAVLFLLGLFKGSQREKAKQARRNLDAVRDKKEIEDEVDGLGSADLDDQFKRWMRHRR